MKCVGRGCSLHLIVDGVTDQHLDMGHDLEKRASQPDVPFVEVSSVCRHVGRGGEVGSKALIGQPPA
jgi:hypothetical protein